MPTDLEIAQAAQPKRIQEIAEKAGIPEGAISPYGQYIAKVDPMQLGVGSEMRAKLILVTAINPTPAGEGKTTVSVGLADGMTKIGKKAMLALREPSLGPVFGMKGGAAAAAGRRCCRWSRLTCTSRAICTPSPPRTTCLPRWWTTTSSRATRWALTRVR